MAQNVTIAGASYSDVPSVELPKTGGGTAVFVDPSPTTAVDSDVASGKIYFKADGTQSVGTSSGGGGSAIVVTDTTDVHGGTIREITAVDLSNDTVDAAHLLQGYTAHDRTGTAITGTYQPQSTTLVTKTITVNGTYDPSDDNADGYSEVTVNVPQGLVIPAGMAYFNGYLLPQIPIVSGYDYAWIRRNNATGNFDLVLGTAQWHSNNGSLDSWALTFNGQSSVGSRQYSIPQNGTTTTATDWGESTSSTNTYGTSNDRKVIWTSHNIMIGTTANVLCANGIALYPPS